MIIENKIFIDWLMKATVGGKIDDVRLNFTKDSLEMLEGQKDATYLSKCTLKKKAFKTYDAIGEIAINNIDRFQTVLKRFPGNVSLEKDGVILKLKSNLRTGEYVMASVESLDKRPDYPAFKDWDVDFGIDSKALKAGVSNSKAIASDAYIEFFTEKGKLIIKTGKDDKINDSIVIPAIKKEGVYTRFGDPLKEVIAIIEDKVNVKFANRHPMVITEKSDFAEYIYFIAPDVEKEETDEDSDEEKTDKKVDKKD